MSHFLFENKEYHIKAAFKRRKEIPDPAVELSRLLKKVSKCYSVSSRHYRDLRQKCVSKMQYSNSLEAHKVQLEKYLGREGTNLDGSAAELFGTDIKEYQNNMVGRNFRIFLSPQSDKIDLKKMTEQFIVKLERQTGYKIYWQGACHYNTAHPHSHLLINGVDKNGKEIKFPKDIIKTFMRETARDLCTTQLGIRTQKDIDVERELELSAQRWTKLDDHIHILCSGLHKINTSKISFERERVLTRLETLRKLNLCTYENGGYVMKDKWEEDLRANGRYNTFLKAREQLQYTDPMLMNIYSGKQGTVTGKVTKIYRTDDDASDNHAVVLEGLDGKAYFIPLLNKPELFDSGKKTLLKEGELIMIKTQETQRGRLTPFFFKREIKSIQKEIVNNNYSGSLAKTLQTTKGLFFGNQVS